jgi:predicted acylesterase/phospholipase RssA/CRP-like cAMP-binding protein
MDRPSLLFDKSLVLRYIPLFNGLNFFERKIISNSLEIVEVKRSQMIYAQGSPQDAFYCILSGRVEIFIDKDGRQETLEYIHRGKYFGFISLLTGEPHSVSARAVNDTVLAKISQRDFNAILKSIPRLAIDLSQMLSRRLKRKDFHPKSIFESTIVSVYSDDVDLLDSSLYALNLALSLKIQTKKQVIVVDAAASGSVVCEALQLGSCIGFLPPAKFFHAQDVNSKIIRHQKGVDVLRVSFSEQKKFDTALLVSVLTLLANDYHYCIVVLTSDCAPEVFKVLSQSDVIHLLVAPDASKVKQMFAAMDRSGVWQDSELKEKIRLCLFEGGEEAAFLHQPIFATLPRPHKHGFFFAQDDSLDPYSKAIRRIARQTGEVLVGLALGSGSAMGLSHIGVLKVLENEGIPIDIVCGSSMGALIGALWCAGFTAFEVENIILKNKNKKYLFGLDDLVFPIHGLIRGKHVHDFLNRYLKDLTFHDIKRPFKVVASDCVSMKQVVFDKGSLVDAVMSSISLPGVFVPYKIGDHYYIDGGILDPLPTGVLVESGAKRIISVNVLPSPDDIERTAGQKNKGRLKRPNIFDVIVSSVQSIEYLLAQSSGLSPSDVILHPDMTAISWADFEKARDLIKRGEEEALLHLQEIRELVS